MRMAVYPRVCGGTLAANTRRTRNTGLSPRVRGNRRAGAARPGKCGSIPACAGEPLRPPLLRASPGVYPRVCGGTISPTWAVPAVPGLSPRVRGNRPPTGSWPTSARVYRTPATLCGKRCKLAYIRKGLSPRVRGNHDQVAAFIHQPRSIPACAGEPGLIARPLRRHGVYPRVCGGTAIEAADNARVPGLSPRVRGNHTLTSVYNPLNGSIPACAGEPSNPRRRSLPDMVYPRVCGGTAQSRTGQAQPLGLSPPVRGNLSSVHPPLRALRSIPACAGEP